LIFFPLLNTCDDRVINQMHFNSKNFFLLKGFPFPNLSLKEATRIPVVEKFLQLTFFGKFLTLLCHAKFMKFSMKQMD